MDIIDMLHDKAQWQRFCDYKFQGGHLSQEEEADLLAFVQQEHKKSERFFCFPGRKTTY